MGKYCENCGCKVFSGRCANCHEELYILDQYIELPSEDTEFMMKVKTQLKEVSEQPINKIINLN